ncbi:MAG: DUF3343 domain-containing protein [Oscillospiraceae bacterium]|nr:DUF3343 domain-containing protein [Oscillospiraceae bacterium]
MRSYFVTFRSVTFAQRGESVLRRAGINCSLQRTPRWMEEQGCGYCLRIQQRDAAAAVELFRQRQVAFRKVYRQSDGAEVEEVLV